MRRTDILSHLSSLHLVLEQLAPLLEAWIEEHGDEDIALDRVAEADELLGDLLYTLERRQEPD